MKSDTRHIKLIFGLKIRQLRLDLEISLTELSNITGISKSYLNEIEKGKKYPKPEKISRLALALNTSYDNLVSLQLQRNLAPISQIIQSDFLDALPLDFFGMEQNDLLKILSSAPTKLSAFVDSIIQIASNYAIRVEHLYFAVLRSYQEMHDNYFPDLEMEARNFRAEYKVIPGSLESTQILENYLVNQCNYIVDEQGLDRYPKLNTLRYLLIPGQRKSQLLLNKRINTAQKLFILAREAGFNYMNLKIRARTSSWVESDTFEHVFNNFKAYYFASAILLHDKIFLRGLLKFIGKKKFNQKKLLDLIRSSKVTPEIFMLRITNLLPVYMKFSSFFFFRYNHDLQQGLFTKTKELYGSGLKKSMGIDLETKSCQRYAAIISLEKFEKQQKLQTPHTLQNVDPTLLSGNNMTVTAFKLRYEQSPSEFLIIGIAQDMKPSENLNCYIGVGFLIDHKFRESTRFINDVEIENNRIGFEWVCNTASRCYDDIESTAIQRENYLNKLKTEIESAIAKES